MITQYYLYPAETIKPNPSAILQGCNPIFVFMFFLFFYLRCLVWLFRDVFLLKLHKDKWISKTFFSRKTHDKYNDIYGRMDAALFYKNDGRIAGLSLSHIALSSGTNVNKRWIV